VALSWWVLFRTRFGLRLRAVGENPPPWTPAAISVARLSASPPVGSRCSSARWRAPSCSTAEPAAGFMRDMRRGAATSRWRR
jgi:simple sugar transport system permease protein